MSNYKLQMYTPDLKNKVCLLQKQIYRSFTWRHAAYLDWKHLRNPYFEEPLVYVALHNERVVGIRAMFGTCWEAGDYTAKLVLPCASDTGIEPEHRDSGLFEELTGYAMEDLRARGFSHVLNLSPTPANYVVSVMTLGWRPMGSSEEMSWGGHSLGLPVATAPHPALKQRMTTKAVSIGLVAGKTIKKAMRINAFADLDRNSRSGNGPVSVYKTPKPQAMADLVRQIGGDGRLRHVRDSTYFSWRFGNPRFCYRFLFWGGEEPDAYMVLQNAVGDRKVNIVDWEGRDLLVRSGLLEAAIKLGQFRTMGTWGATLPGSAIGTLQQAGFTYANVAGDSSGGYGGRFMLKPIGPDAGNSDLLGRHPLEQENWDLRMIYSDGA